MRTRYCSEARAKCADNDHAKLGLGLACPGGSRARSRGPLSGVFWPLWGSDLVLDATRVRPTLPALVVPGKRERSDRLPRTACRPARVGGGATPHGLEAEGTGHE